MAKQRYKSVYFSDYPSGHSAKRKLTLAFGERDEPISTAVASLSSYELRSALGFHSYHALKTAADRDGLPVNTFCIRELRRRYSARSQSLSQAILPGFANSKMIATFRRSNSKPLHRWYPFPEGYSPDFVQFVLSEFAPEARRVCDPFAGVGTTPIAAAGQGLVCFYCELNPLLQFLTETKLSALAMDLRERNQYADTLENLAESLPHDLQTYEPDEGLRRSFRAVFGTSQFFPNDAFEEILRVRRLLDKLACSKVPVARLATVAALASLVPSSLLIRAGDLRFRRDHELERMSKFAGAFVSRLRIIAEDLVQLERVEETPLLIGEDAKSLGLIPSLELDAVVTSPPYLNGTNYFRNTKMELWFLRTLLTPGDLRFYRHSAVTAGINDVQREKTVSAHPTIQRISAQLESSAYDSRIARMVGSYFYDLERVLAALTGHLKNEAVVAIDIGDSAYANVHVPTDDLLVEVAAPFGYELEQAVHLRTRVSRNTTALRQTLLVLRYKKERGDISVRRSLRFWDKRWQVFKDTIPHQKLPYAKRNWGHPLHSLCSYQGKMKPSLAHHLVRTFARPGGRMLDPFAGVGTIPFEAALQGIEAFGLEISPAAAIIASGKIGVLNPLEIEDLLKRLAEFLDSNEPSDEERRKAVMIRFNGGLADYFHAKTFDEILVARRFFRLYPPENASEQFVMASVLHILHGNRPYALSRRSHPVTPFAPGGRLEYRALLPRLRAKINRGLALGCPPEFVPGKIFQWDATTWWPHEVDNLDAVITSPPFFDSTRFYLSNWMRLWFAGWEREDFNTEPLSFVDERQKREFRVYEPVFRQARERLRPDGVVVLHLGKSRKCDMAAEVERIAAPWFTVVDRFVENVEHVESHGIRDKGTVTDHQYVVLQ